MKQLTKEQSIQVLIQASQLAQKAGALSLQDAKLVATAVETLNPQEVAQAQSKLSENQGEPEAEAPQSEH